MLSYKTETSVTTVRVYIRNCAKNRIALAVYASIKEWPDTIKINQDDFATIPVPL
ncbi:hypothetical protein MYVALT_F_00380 [Candidatus Vallotia tarda]|uniref:Uncharacterized protein n=1 Tax=Candidatus Vallotiella hemipterorum TaxID=1177213 RepID=A0A916NFN9_9BURK|nr:hypothetical protein MYVALT_F_00380 [Candidatus Vallotia tarda]